MKQKGKQSSRTTCRKNIVKKLKTKAVHAANFSLCCVVWYVCGLCKHVLRKTNCQRQRFFSLFFFLCFDTTSTVRPADPTHKRKAVRNATNWEPITGQGITLVFLQSRINLSPFTKDFRGGEHRRSLRRNFFVPLLRMRRYSNKRKDLFEWWVVSLLLGRENCAGAEGKYESGEFVWPFFSIPLRDDTPSLTKKKSFEEIWDVRKFEKIEPPCDDVHMLQLIPRPSQIYREEGFGVKLELTAHGTGGEKFIQDLGLEAKGLTCRITIDHRYPSPAHLRHHFRVLDNT